jgi:Novel STAND NTPase 1/TIR domain
MSQINKQISMIFASFPPVNVSFYFDSSDRVFCEALDRQLAPLKQNGRLHTWDERQVLPGQERDREQEHHLTTDHLLVLLISPNFLASEACLHQMEVALQRHSSGDATVIPILVRPCLWEQTELKKLQMLPREQNALGAQPSPEALQEIATELNKVIDSIQQRVFITYAPEDGDVVERLHRDLALSSVRLWSPERKQLTPDLGQNQEVRAAMRDASMVLLIASPATVSSSVMQAQMALAADYARPVLVFWARGEDWEPPHPEEWRADVVIDARADRYERACIELVAHAKEQGCMLLSPQAERLLPKEPRNPYKGLHAFTADDTRDFFGREALVGELAGTLERIILQENKGESPSRLLTVLGASGSGKSSVVMAGLLPYLQRQGIADSREWIYLDPIVPGTHPLEELAATLARQPSLGNGVAGSVLSLHHALDADSLRTLHLLARQLAGSSTHKVVLFIDQFEEVFTLTASEEERQRFFDLLVTAVTEPHGPLLVLLTLRADFYDRPMQYAKLYRLLDAHRVSVLPMEREDLRRVIERPAQLPEVQLSFEGDLVGDLLFDVREQGASLPLLEFTLEQLFARREGHQLTLQAYRDIGGVKGALVKHADETYATLPSEEHRKLAQLLFTRLIEPGTMQQDMTRRRAIREEFELPDPSLTQLLRATLAAFIAARLLTINEIAGTTTIEISHEALIREWPRCAQWIQETRENLPFQQTLSKDVTLWEELGEPKDRLYRGSQLKTMKKRIDLSLLNKQEVRFLHTSTVHQRQQWIKMSALLLLPVLVLGLILTPLLVFRPSWCPSWLCPAPQVLLAKGGAHDSNLQVTFQTLQSSIKVIPGDPSSYTLSNLPMANDAQLINTNQVLPYRVVLKIHSLQQGRYGLVINSVALMVNSQAKVIPYPLRVWVADNVSTFTNNLYRVTYRGQGVKALLTALYVAQPSGLVSLLPGETDELSLEVRSALVVDLHFQVQISYHVIGQLVTHTLTLPNIFEVIFSDPANWHPYQLQNGHLVATRI